MSPERRPFSGSKFPFDREPRTHHHHTLSVPAQPMTTPAGSTPMPPLAAARTHTRTDMHEYKSKSLYLCLGLRRRCRCNPEYPPNLVPHACPCHLRLDAPGTAIDLHTRSEAHVRHADGHPDTGAQAKQIQDNPTNAHVHSSRQ